MTPQDAGRMSKGNRLKRHTLFDLRVFTRTQICSQPHG
jgi:hypothetical protein